MLIGVPKEIYPGEARVCHYTFGYTGTTGQRLFSRCSGGLQAMASHFGDEEYRACGASIARLQSLFMSKPSIILKVRNPQEEELPLLKENSTLICLMDAWFNLPMVEKLAAQKVRSFALEFIPRTTRAQSMDVLSSMGAISGYRSVLTRRYGSASVFPDADDCSGHHPPG